ncbi:MAG: amino acid ABC transporter substrate-binding protein [Desulfobacteraceae bacterium]|nr:amino acid ABC transporter substrate-binding protein [Desulfobacteraceae bacterium]
MKRILICSILLIFTICSSSWSKDYFFVTFQYPPLEYEDDNGTAKGVCVEMVSKIMKNLGHEVKIQVFPWTRALKMTRDGKADAIFTAYKNENRQTFLDYSNEVLFPQTIYFYKKKGSNLTFEGDLMQLKDVQIGVVSTISYGTKFDSVKSSLCIQKANKLEHNFVKLRLGRISLVPSYSCVADYVLKKMNLEDDIVKIPVQIDSVPSYIAFSKKIDLAVLKENFDKEIITMKKNGEYASMLKAFGVQY